ncbi:MAG: ABC transporter ATP-binding protein [Anaerolineales bacterium]
MPAVEVKNLFKSYNDQIAVKNLSFRVDPGEILGLIGPNGAGKSSTIKIILDFMKPDSGEIALFGGPMSEEKKNRIGYLPEARGLYKELKVLDCILYLASLKGMDKTTAKERAVQLLERTGMIESEKKKIKHLSKGMSQMIQFIVTIIHNPELLIMDEPFSGLDPVNTELMKNMVGKYRDEGKAIILSTHQMNQVEELCDRVLMIDHGEEVLYGNLREIKSRFKKHSVQVSLVGDMGDLNGVTEIRTTKDGFELLLAEDGSPQSVLDQLRSQGLEIQRFEITTPSLHSIFLNMVASDHG